MCVLVGGAQLVLGTWTAGSGRGKIKPIDCLLRVACV